MSSGEIFITGQFYIGNIRVDIEQVFTVFVLILGIALAFSALLMRNRSPKYRSAVLALSLPIPCIFILMFSGSLVSGIRLILKGSDGDGFGAALVGTLAVAVFWFLAYRKKDRLVTVIAAVLAVIIACNTVVWGILQFGDLTPSPSDDDMGPDWGENPSDIPDEDWSENPSDFPDEGSSDQGSSESVTDNGVYMVYRDAEEEGTCYLSFVNAYGRTVDLLTVPSVSPSGKRVVGINYWVFSGEEIKDFVLPDTLEWISYNAFEDTPFFENEQNWEGGCLYIGEYLVGCREPMEGETTLTVKDGTRLIADNIIWGDWKEVVIPESLEYIGKNPLIDCHSLETITVAPENPVYHTKTGCLIERASKTLIAAVNTASIPDDGSVLHIGACAFEGKRDLSTALPDCILTIGEYAFHNCGFTVFPAQLPRSLVEVGAYAFNNCSYSGWGGLTLQIPATTVRIGRNAFTSFNKLGGIRVADGNPVYRSAGDCLIETASGTLLCGGSDSVIPNDGSVRKIEEDAFSYTRLENVAIPEGVTHIGYGAFSGCHLMKSISFPSTLQEIGAYAFGDCYELQKIFIPSGVTKIGHLAFLGCESLSQVTLSEGLLELGGNAFSNCDSLTAIHLPRSLKKIGTEGDLHSSGVMGVFRAVKDWSP